VKQFYQNRPKSWQLSSELAWRVEFSLARGTKLRSKAPMRNITNVSALSIRSWLKDPAAMSTPASPQCFDSEWQNAPENALS